MDSQPWDEALKGKDCYLCQPREKNNEYRREIEQLTISTLYLFGDQRFRGYCLLVFDPYHATSIEQLPEDEYNLLMKDLRQAAQAIRLALKPDHMNYESLGNSGPHIHWHIIPRYQTDPRWGQPIWEGWGQRNEFNVNRFTLSDKEYQEIIDKIRIALKGSVRVNRQSKLSTGHILVSGLWRQTASPTPVTRMCRNDSFVFLMTRHHAFRLVEPGFAVKVV